MDDDLGSPFLANFISGGSIYITEGVKGLWKGLGANLVGVAPSRAIYFSVYEFSKGLYGNGHDTPLVHLLSAAAGTTVTTFATNPIWLIKTRLQLQSNSNLTGTPYKGNIDCLIRVVNEEGVRALYKGASASLLGISESSIHFMIYEYLKKTFRARNSEKKGKLNSRFSENIDVIAFAATSKFIATTLTYPHEVLRTRLREQPNASVVSYNGIIDAFKKIFQNEGIRGFYGGYTINIVRVIPNSMITLFCYEMAASVLRKL